jgi:hypothetical protein
VVRIVAIIVTCYDWPSLFANAVAPVVSIHCIIGYSKFRDVTTAQKKSQQPSGRSYSIDRLPQKLQLCLSCFDLEELKGKILYRVIMKSVNILKNKVTL